MWPWFCPRVCLDSPALCELNESFLSVARERQYKVLSFAETLPTTIGPMIRLLVVPPQSAGEWRLQSLSGICCCPITRVLSLTRVITRVRPIAKARTLATCFGGVASVEGLTRGMGFYQLDTFKIQFTLVSPNCYLQFWSNKRKSLKFCHIFWVKGYW